MHKSQYIKQGLGYCDLVYNKWRDHIRYDHKNPTKKHSLKSHALLFKITFHKIPTATFSRIFTQNTIFVFHNIQYLLLYQTLIVTTTKV